MKALFELVLVIVAAFVARAILGSIVRGVFQASSQRGQQPGEFKSPPQQAPANSTGELHKDPVCGTYVAENAAFRRQAGGRTFYYCSDECRAKHSLAAH